MEKKIRRLVIFSVVIGLILEIVVCNFRTWESLTWKPVDLLKNSELQSEINVEIKDDAIFVAAFRNDGWCDIDTGTLEYVAGGVYNAFIHLYYLDKDMVPIMDPVSVTMKARDEGNDLFYTLGNRTVIPTGVRENYFRLNLAGKAKQLEFTFHCPKEQVKYVCIEKLVLNKPVPLHISLFRLIVIGGFVFLFCIACPSSNLWKMEISSWYRINFHVLFTVLWIFLATMMIWFNPANRSNSPHDEYSLLTESLLKGNVYLEEKPAQTLITMENPYDKFLRDKVMNEAGEKWNLDWAYFKGKYYVYIRILPVLLFFLPYYVITGMHISYGAIAIIINAFWASGISWLLYQIYKRYFPSVSILSFYLWNIMLLVGTGQMYALRYPSLYSTPIFLAGACSVWGMGFWISSLPVRDNDLNGLCGEKICLKKVATGSLLISITALSRPQFLIVGLMAFVIFGKWLFEKPHTKSKVKWKLWFALGMPALLICIVTMYYNYIRFGSIFDFGANYNLTSNDMTHRGIHIDRFFSGIFYYLFEPTKIGCIFPFIIDSGKMTVGLTDYLGRSIVEAPYGGLIFNRPILFLSFEVIKARKYIKQISKEVWHIAIFFVASAMIILFADIQMAGIVSRYNMDYGWLLCLAALLLFNSIEVVSDDRTLKKFVRGLLLFSVCWSVVYEFLLLCANLDKTIFLPYYQFRNLLQFWL